MPNKEGYYAASARIESAIDEALKVLEQAINASENLDEREKSTIIELFAEQVENIKEEADEVLTDDPDKDEKLN